MKAYIESDKRGMPANINFFKAYQGLHDMGFETVFFTNEEQLKNAEPDNLVVGFVGTVKRHLLKLGIQTPDIDYPLCLFPYLGRNIWKSTLNTINSNPELWPVFIKPMENKQFTGAVIRTTKDLVGCGAYVDKDSDVYCSEVVDFVTEWRVFVRYGRIVGVCQYTGDWRQPINGSLIERCIADYADAPAGYSADFGLTNDGRLLLIEINDGYSLGSYGLYYPDYTKLLLARWAELTNTRDEFELL